MNFLRWICFLLASPCTADITKPSSLFLTPEEVSNFITQESMEKEAETKNKIVENEPLLPKEETSLTLGAILFQSPESWTLWLNGTCISNDQQNLEQLFPGLSFVHIEADSVTVALNQGPSKIKKKIKLYPGKTCVIPKL